ncbi:MAG: 3-dehydroquinate synthase [Candidatus Aquicultorales bacterium]
MSDLSSVRLNLGRHSYEIKIGSGVLDRFGRVVRDCTTARRLAVVTNETVWSLHGETLLKGLEDAEIDPTLITVPEGEQAKSLPVAEKAYGALIDAGFERAEPIAAFGGGVVGDLTGFVAGTYMRGVPLFHVPTTFLAQIDSSIGGKVAINHPKGKNLIGLFYQPIFVFSDVDILQTLNAREMRNGLAEAIKYGFIWENGPLEFIEEHLDAILAAEPEILRPLVEACARIKARVVEIDEKDRGLRAVLNYGHTFGHAVETSSEYAFSHGEAVAVGMVFAAELANRLGMIDQSVVWRHRKLIERAGLPTRAEGIDPESLIRSMALDKKRAGGENLFVLLEGYGKPIVRPVPGSLVEQLVDEFV